MDHFKTQSNRPKYFQKDTFNGPNINHIRLGNSSFSLSKNLGSRYGQGIRIMSILFWIMAFWALTACQSQTPVSGEYVPHESAGTPSVPTIPAGGR